MVKELSDTKENALTCNESIAASGKGIQKREILLVDKMVKTGAPMSSPLATSNAGSFCSPVRSHQNMLPVSPALPQSAGKLEIKEAAMALTWLSEAFEREAPTSPVALNHTAASNALLSADRTNTGPRSRRAASQRCVNTLREALAAERELLSHGRNVKAVNKVTSNVARTARRVSRTAAAANAIPSEKKTKGYSRNSRVGRAMESIFEYICRHQDHYMNVNGSGVPERIVRQEFGNNPDTSKALRFLVSEHRIVRSGAGGRRDPYSYTIARASHDKKNIAENSETEMNQTTEASKQNKVETNSIAGDISGGSATPLPIVKEAISEGKVDILSPNLEDTLTGQTPLAPATILNPKPHQPRFSLTGVEGGFSAIKSNSNCKSLEEQSESKNDTMTGKRLVYGSLLSPSGAHDLAKNQSSNETNSSTVTLSTAGTPLLKPENAMPLIAGTPATTVIGAGTEGSCQILQPFPLAGEAKRCINQSSNMLPTPAGFLIPLPPQALKMFAQSSHLSQENPAFFAQYQPFGVWLAQQPEQAMNTNKNS